jgi:hypothetical protein
MTVTQNVRLTTWPRVRFRPNRVHVLHRRLFGRTACGLLVSGKAWVWEADLNAWPDPCAKCIKAQRKEQAT